MSPSLRSSSSVLPSTPLPSDILVVDDTPANLVAIGVALENLPYRLVKVSSGEQALRAVLERDFALILLDVQMPGLDGFESARLIRARSRSRHVPIIFVTAYDSNDKDVLEAYGLGAVDFLFKPIRPDVLRAKASVFVELQRRTAEVERQAQQIRVHEQLERERALAEQRARLQAEALQERLEEQRRHASELRALNRRLEEDDRRKDEFIAVLGHELRNPLAPLVNGLELLQASDDEGVARARTVMKRQVDHLVRLVDDLLDMARVTRGKIELRRQVLRIGDAMSQAVALASPLVEEREHELEIVREHMDLLVEGDELRLTQTIANLLNNAARYTDTGGRITLSVRPSDGGILVEVADTGRGMPPELVPHVFDLFVQEKAGGGGLGIGLTLVKRLVGLHGGHVEASSEGVGRGSVFRVWLPERKASPDDAPGDAPAPGAAEVARPLSVTLVEDNEDARLMMCEMLTRWGHDVRQATDGEQGVAMILAEPPDIAFIDIGLPDTDGYDVARRVRAEFGPSRPRLVALSGFGQRRDRERATSVGFDHHLTKPTSVETLQRLLLDTSRRLEQCPPEPCQPDARAQLLEK